MKIAIIGTGISGLAAAYMLNSAHDITVFEKNDYSGGHSRTITLPQHANIPVDTGFIVFNKRNYPLLTRLFTMLDVPVVKSDMSFGVSIAGGWLEYGSKNMLAQKRNLLRPAYWRMIFDILRFNRIAANNPAAYEGKSLREFLDSLKMGNWFEAYYLQAMGAAIWSCSAETILNFPAKTFITFFKNHGLLTINDHPQWYTVKGGSREYIKRLTPSFSNKIKHKTAIVSIQRHGDKVLVTDDKGNVETYDQVVFACHANEALAMIKDADDNETKILSQFKYQKNKVLVHGDVSFMPERRPAWASWVYLSDNKIDEKNSVSLTYWMNNLQSLETNEPVFVTLNPGREPKPDLIYDTHIFSHPVFNNETYWAQNNFSTIQGQNKYWFCGAYHRYGFHEDGLLSAVNIVKQMGVDVPWTA